MNPLLENNNDCRLITSVLTDVLDAQFGVTVLPNFPAGRVRPVIESVSPERFRLVIPVGQEEGKPVVAVGTLDAKPGEILEKLLGLAVRYILQGRRLDEQHLDLDAYARQISRDFEELTWLRSLPNYLKDRDQEGSTENLLEAILLPLCSLIGAEQIILLAAEPQATEPGQEVPKVGQVVVRVGPGKQVVDDPSCCKLVDRLREVAGTQSLVQTGMKRRREFSVVPQIDSCILVPVVRRQSLLGWLLAVNRVSGSVDSDPTASNDASQLAEEDYGTFEANLLDFAAVILAAHARCTELLGQGAAAQEQAVATS